MLRTVSSTNTCSIGSGKGFEQMTRLMTGYEGFDKETPIGLHPVLNGMTEEEQHTLKVKLIEGVTLRGGLKAPIVLQRVGVRDRSLLIIDFTAFK
mmetsp:Transcript_10719/g.35160  ORF Transcript_10719/g.35160 Transcript_10719/m.35160 type:complete len:95 (+) Transcript_10719:509-793(+)